MRKTFWRVQELRDAELHLCEQPQRYLWIWFEWLSRLRWSAWVDCGLGVGWGLRWTCRFFVDDGEMRHVGILFLTLLMQFHGQITGICIHRFSCLLFNDNR